MRLAAHNRSHLLAGRRRPGEQGLTLIELLLSLAILAVLTGFLAGGLAIGHYLPQAVRMVMPKYSEGNFNAYYPNCLLYTSDAADE